MDSEAEARPSSGATIASKASLILDLPPSCIEFCPVHPSYFVVGTYNLVKEEVIEEDDPNSEQNSASRTTQNRNGSLIVFRLEDGVPVQVQTVQQPSALLDLHFGHSGDNQDILGVVSSTGTFSVFRLTPENSSSEPLQHISTSSVPDIEAGVLFLSFAWHPSLRNFLAITMSNGLACLVNLDSSTFRIKSGEAMAVANTLECWCVAFSPKQDEQDESHLEAGHQTFVVYSGGDDSTLRYRSYSVQDAIEGEIETTDSSLHPNTVINKTHTAGVTAILPLPVHLEDGARIVITGSYDDTLRAFSIRDPDDERGVSRARVLTEENLGGGVWRLKVISTDSVALDKTQNWRFRLLASCMHTGTRIVDITIPTTGEDLKVEVAGRFEEHKSMNYGSDFTPRPDGGITVVSTSFYDRLLCVWDI